MADLQGDRVAESTVTTGTGDINLAGAISTDHATFGSQFADGDEFPCSVFGGGKWMTFRGRYNSGANSITRVTFRRSSTGSNLSLSGTMTVMCGWTAAEAIAALNIYADTQGVTQVPGTAADQAAARAVIGVDRAVQAKSADYTVLAADYGALFKLTGSFTLSLTAAATLGDGWKCDIRNTSTGVWTIDPSGSETVNGLAIFKVYPGENFRLICDGTSFHTVGTGTGLVLLDTKIAASSATLDFNRFDAGRFYSYRFEIELLLPSTAAASLLVRHSNDNGVNYISSSTYLYGFLAGLSGTTAAAAEVLVSPAVDLVSAQGTSSGYAMVGTVDVTPGSSHSILKAFQVTLDSSGGHTRPVNIYGQMANQTNAIRFLYSSGNIASGTIRQYGLSR